MEQRIDTSGSNFAQNTAASLTRQQYFDYLRQGYPIENQLLSFAQDRTQPAQAAASAMGTVAKSFDRIEGQLERRQSRMGLASYDPAATQAQKRAINTQQGLATATAANRAATDTADLQQEILAGAPTASSRGLAGFSGAKR